MFAAASRIFAENEQPNESECTLSVGIVQGCRTHNIFFMESSAMHKRLSFRNLLYLSIRSARLLACLLACLPAIPLLFCCAVTEIPCICTEISRTKTAPTVIIVYFGVTAGIDIA